MSCCILFIILGEKTPLMQYNSHVHAAVFRGDPRTRNCGPRHITVGTKFLGYADLQAYRLMRIEADMCKWGILGGNDSLRRASVIQSRHDIAAR
jgi:hypothetical protein